MRALRFEGLLRVINDAPLPARRGEAIVQVLRAGICNTDLEIVKGYAGFQGTLGHEFVGRVVESPESGLVGRRVAGEINAGCGHCELCRAGDSRHCRNRTVLGIKERDGAFADFLSLPAANLVEVPDAIEDSEAVFIEPLAAAAGILERIEINRATRVALVGDGKLAQLIARVIGVERCSVTVVGKHPKKLELMGGVGERRLQLPDAGLDTLSLQRWLKQEELHHAFDHVIEASGAAAGLSLALEMARPRGSIVLKSTYHGRSAADLTGVVVNELSIVGSRCGRFGPAISMLSRRSVDVRPLITAEFPIEDGIAAFAEAALPNSMKVLLRFD